MSSFDRTEQRKILNFNLKMNPIRKYQPKKDKYFNLVLAGVMVTTIVALIFVYLTGLYVDLRRFF